LGSEQVVDRKARIEIRAAAVESRVAVPLIAAALGGDDDRCGSCAAGVGVFLRRADGKFLDRIR